MAALSSLTDDVLVFLGDWCDVRCLDAFLHVIQNSIFEGEMAAARDGILKLLTTYGSNIDSGYAEILMNLPDKVGLTRNQSDYSWDQGQLEDVKISMESIRSKERVVWA